MVEPSKVGERFRVGAIVFAKCSHVLENGYLGCYFGARAGKMWVPGRVDVCTIKQSKNGRAICYVTCCFFLGGFNEKQKEIGISLTKDWPPEGCFVPEGIVGINLQDVLFPTVASATAVDVPDTSAKGPCDGITALPSVRLFTGSTFMSAEQPAVVAATSSDTTDAPTVNVNEILEQGLPLECHGIKWLKDYEALTHDCNRTPCYHAWHARDALGNEYSSFSDPEMWDTRYDYFRQMVPYHSIKLTLSLTNDGLEDMKEPVMDYAELLLFYGILLLGTRFEFCDRRSLWSDITPTRFMAPPNFVKIGMWRNQFDNIWHCLRFSEQPAEMPDGMNAEDYRWMLVDDHVALINESREKYYTPSTHLVVDDSMARWYGIGGDWINQGLPMYVAMDRKPESGCEIQNVCDGDTSIMLHLLLVKSSNSVNRKISDDALNHGAKIIKWLCQPWTKSNRFVYADSYFSSVQTAQELYRMGLRFTGVVKTSHRGFPMKYLTELQFQGHREWSGLYHKGNDTIDDPDMYSFAWVDRNRRYFITTVSNLRPTAPIKRSRIRQIVRDCISPPVKVNLQINQPNCSKQYYDNCGRIDQHNRLRQDDLKLERKFGTHDWSKRVNLALFGMCIVDSYLMHKAVTGCKDSPQEFFSKLADELIDYGRGSRATRRAKADAAAAAETAATTRATNCTGAVGRHDISAGIGPHLTPNKKRAATAGEEEAKLQLIGAHRPNSNYTEQRQCSECKTQKRTWLCSECLATTGERHAVCHTKYRGQCWENHLMRKHADFAAVRTNS